MKMKSLFLPALALALFTACSGEEALTSENNVQQTTQDDAVTFDAYLNRTVTRGGYAGSIELTQLETAGFGVFGYYSDGELYSENAIPDFMYNQRVTYSGSAWTYSPIKYWPNEFGSKAVSTGVDRVTFFAYAPYVGVDPTTGQLVSSYYDNSTPEKSNETGITALTRNGKAGDPYVRYVGAFNPDDCVDLLYGVAAEYGTSGEGFTSSVGATDGANNIAAGSPFINVAKPDINAKLKFNFLHALAKLTVKVDADVDVVGHSEGDAFKDDNTRIWIRSITFDGIADRGYLNLNNGMWYEVMGGNKISHASVTIYDGRRDGAEPIAEDDYETPQDINPELIQSSKYSVELVEDPVTKVSVYRPVSSLTTTSGVTASLQSLFGGSSSNDLMVIPANEQLKVTIVYDVETVDASLPNYLSDSQTKGSTVENRITKAITMGGNALKLDAGKAYTLNLHLGMTSVKFEADVTDWDTSDTPDDTWLPVNGPTVKAGTPNYPYSVPAAAGTYTFRITDLTAGSSMNTPDATGDITFNPAPSFAKEDNVSGVLTAKVDANTSVNKKTSTITLTEKDESDNTLSTTTINITQAAAPLGLSVDMDNITTTTIKLTASATDGWSLITDATSDRITVKKNGIELTGKAALTPSENEYTFNNSSGVITLADDIEVGDVFAITVKASNDVEAETYTLNIGSISFAQATVPIKNGTTDYTNPLTNTGTGTVKYEVDAGSATISDDTKNVVNVGANGTATIKATVTDDVTNGWYYLTKTATYTLAIGDVVFAAGGNYEWACPKDEDTYSLVICGLTPSGTVSVTETTDTNNISSNEKIEDGVSGSTSGKADATGIAHVSAKLEANSASVKEATLTVTDDGKTMTITIKQAF